MLTAQDKEWLEELLHERYDARLVNLEKEVNHYRKHLITVEEARNIFRTETLRVNAWTRISVAIIAALAVIGNGTSNVLVDHSESKAMARYSIETDRKLVSYESRISQSNRELVSDIRSALAERDSHLETLIVRAKEERQSR